MQLYKDLAIKTFNKIFRDRHYSAMRDLNKVQTLIQKNLGLISNKADRTLYVYELGELIGREKIIVDFRHKSNSGTIAMNDFEFTSKLHSWLTLTENIEIEKNENTEKWLCSVSLLEKLADVLIIEKLIEQESGELFVNLFLRSDGPTVKWLGATTLLVYLFEQLKAKKMINNSVSNKFIESNFYNETGFISNTKQVKSTISGHRPRRSNLIDEMITSIYNTLPKS